MKGRILTVALSLVMTMAAAQEFKVHENGLIYSDTTMKQLAFIVDSLNLKFRSCGLTDDYRAKFQAMAHYVRVEEGDILAARADMEANMPYEEFIQKHKVSESDAEVLVVKYKYENYNGHKEVEFSSIPIGKVSRHQVEVQDEWASYEKDLKDTWVFDYWEGGDYSSESIRGFYFISEFQSDVIPEKYGRMIQYADCMVDTTTRIFIETETGYGYNYPDRDKPKKVEKFMEYVGKSTEKPKYKKDKKNYWDKYEKWNEKRLQVIDENLAGTERFNELLTEAVAEALIDGGSDNEFEEYVARYYNKETALELKRRRRVIGFCSQDRGPRIHAVNIAMLSAETVNWETFLRAHLDIMNDNFARQSDGSYAWGARGTYIKELEVLDIDVADLIFGISMRFEDPNENHYYGDIRRLGRALSETNFADEMETEMLNMVSDNELDTYNRMIIYYLYLNYNSWLEDEDRQEENIRKLIEAGQDLPEYLSRHLDYLEEKN